MNPLLRSSIRELRDAQGVELDPLDDLHHILTLKDLADRVVRVQKDLRTEALLHPVKHVPGLTLRRLAMGSNDFLQNEVADWYDPGSIWTALSFAFCHAHAADPAEIWIHRGNPRTWKKTLKRWKRSLKCSEAELIQAVQEFQNEVDDLNALLQKGEGPKSQAQKDPDEDGSGNLGGLVELLAATYSSQVPDGMTAPEFWIWRVPMDEVELIASAFLERTEKESRQKAKAGEAFAQDPDKTYIRAHHALRGYMDKIVEEKKGADNAVRK